MKKLMFITIFSLLALGAWAQKTVSGTVTDASGVGLPGVNVVVKGTTIGIATDIDGKWTLNVPSEDSVLQFSAIGMKNREVKASSASKVKLEADTQMLDEVIVTAFGTSTKEAFTGSGVQLDSEELEKRQVSNVLQALTGKVPGIRMTSSNNQPGTSPSIQIRGVGSFSAGRAPLYVVDGVPFSGDISTINPQDIESTTVLKDAASAALYGARGANGVIMIQTKSGVKTRSAMKVSVEGRYGLNSRAVPNYDVFKSPNEYSSKFFESIYNHHAYIDGKSAEEAFKLASQSYQKTMVYVPYTYPNGENLFVQNQGRFNINPNATLGRMLTGADGSEYWLTTDNWQDEIYESNPRQEYNVSISGNGEKANYFFSTSFLDDKGYIVSSGYKRYTTRLRTDFEPAEWIKMGGNLSYTHAIADRLSGTTSGGSSGNIFAVTNYIAPIYPLYLRGGDKKIMVDKFGNQRYDFGTQEYPGLKRPFLSIANPLSLYKLDTRRYTYDVISAKGYVDFKPIKDLKVTLNVGYDVNNRHLLDKKNVYYGQFAQYGGIVSRDQYRGTGLNLQQLVTYKKEIDDHNFDILLGHEYYKQATNTLYGSKENMYHPDNTEISGAILKPNTGSSMSEYVTEGYLGRFQYDFDKKYFASFSFRRDASSNFHPDNRWGTFWSVGGAWLINKESFMDNYDWIDMLKVKVSYGEQGNDDIGAFRYTDLYSISNANDKLAASFSSKGNKDITWETSKNFNVGTEFELWNKKLTGGIDYFSREVSDMLFWRPVPRSAGYSGYYDNVGSMKNSGVEFYFTVNPINTNDIKWSITFNGAHVKNELTKLPAEWEAVEDGYRDGSSVYRVGGSIYDRAYPHYLGVNEEGKPKWQTYDKDTKEYGETTEHSVAVEKDNRKIYSNMAPDLNGGFSTSLEAFGFDFNIGLTYQLGGLRYDGNYANLMHGGQQGDSGHNWHKDILNSWTPENKNTNVPMVALGSKYANSLSDRFLIGADYLAVDNISLGYNFPKRITERLNISDLRIYLAADNVYVFSKRKGLDPRFTYSVGYSSIRTVSAGVKFSF